MGFIVCHGNGVWPKLRTCLSGFLGSDTSADAVDVDRVIQVVGRVDSVLGFGALIRFDGMSGG